MIKSNRILAYYGPCSKLCRDNGEVCGINGVTYKSECEAWSGIYIFIFDVDLKGSKKIYFN